MAHFAQLDEESRLVSVLVLSNEDITDEDGNEVEALGVALCEKLVGPGMWVQTSYHGNFRRRYADMSLGVVYNADHDVFTLPQPYPSWLLDLEDPDDWVAPIPKPTEEGYWYEWDEGEQTWIPHEIEQPTE